MRPRFLLFLLAFVSLSTRTARANEDEDDDNFRPDVFACEDAVSHLAACCPQFRARAVRCVYTRHTESGCDAYTTFREDPAIPIDQAECVLALDCGALRERGVCDRARRLVPERDAAHYEMGIPTDGTTSRNTEALCR